MASAGSGDENGGHGGGCGDFRLECVCGAGLCTVKPIRLNPRFLFVCCPHGQADYGGCGFMQWRDTVVTDNITTHWGRAGAPPPSTSPPRSPPQPTPRRSPSPHSPLHSPSLPSSLHSSSPPSSILHSSPPPSSISHSSSLPSSHLHSPSPPSSPLRSPSPTSPLRPPSESSVPSSLLSPASSTASSIPSLDLD